jgi:hypothetical protein
MNDSIKVSQAASVEVVRAPKPADKIGAKGRFKVEHWRAGKLIGEYEMPNAITNEGRSKLLNVMFDAQAEITSWWMGIVDSTGYTSLQTGDSYVQIGGTNSWKEYTYYTDGNNGNSTTTRPAWGAGAATVVSNVASVTNATSAVFNITSGGSGDVKGLFIVGGLASSQTKGDATTGNVLWSAALFTGGDVTILNGDQLKVTYTVSA